MNAEVGQMKGKSEEQARGESRERHLQSLSMSFTTAKKVAATDTTRAKYKSI